MAKFDIKAAVTAKIIEALEAGVAPWARPWKGGESSWPHNASTGRQYSGVNVFLLEAAAHFGGYATNGWMTFKQAKAMGGSVRKGEKSTMIIFWKFLKKEDKVTGEEKTIPLLRYFNVFNVSQIDGLPEAEDAPEVPEVERHARAAALTVATGAEITYGSARACYKPASHSIEMPDPEQFTDVGAFHATELHELIHWTKGAHKSMERGLSYGEEELVAELGSAFLCAELGVEGKLQHPEYIGSWIATLKASNQIIFTVASKARKAANFIMDFEDTEAVEEMAA